MDPLGQFLDRGRARQAFLLRVTMQPPWSMSIEDRAPLTVMAMTSGTGVLRLPGRPPLTLPAGSVAVINTAEPYVVAHTATQEPSVVIGPGGHCSGPGGHDLAAEHSALRTWGNDPQGSDVMVVGSYPYGSAAGGLLTDALPAIILERAADTAVVDLLVTEIDRDDVAQGVVLDRLLDLLLVTTLRQWHGSAHRHRASWLSASRDPALRTVISAMHSAPDHPWSVAELAQLAQCSRASLSARFTERIGTPPMTYLGRWRLGLAAELLTEGDLTLAAIAGRVGYRTPFSLSSAFKNQFGVSPREYRDRVQGEQLSAG
ncbi:MAG: AraC family transcriptional regulator [Nakamurella sp.]